MFVRTIATGYGGRLLAVAVLRGGPFGAPILVNLLQNGDRIARSIPVARGSCQGWLWANFYVITDVLFQRTVAKWRQKTRSLTRGRKGNLLRLSVRKRNSIFNYAFGKSVVEWWTMADGWENFASFSILNKSPKSFSNLRYKDETRERIPIESSDTSHLILLFSFSYPESTLRVLGIEER